VYSIWIQCHTLWPSMSFLHVELFVVLKSGEQKAVEDVYKSAFESGRWSGC